ncbi:MAG: hypothetical protein JW779_15730 [Candidatus Thorarchaeota archaeon]|nr:hypothetical protein [Candidatus Thorarchaeota archaeon]
MIDSADIRFIMVFPKIPIDGEFSFQDLPGSGKRIDVLCRSLAACFDWCPTMGLPIKMELVAVLSDMVLLTFTTCTDCIGKGETWWAKIIQSTLKDQNPPDFVNMSLSSLEDYLSMISAEGDQIFVLDEAGESVGSFGRERSSQYSFMLGNHEGFDGNTREVIRKFKLPSVSLGNTSFLGSQCIAMIISRFERRQR